MAKFIVRSFAVGLVLLLVLAYSEGFFQIEGSVLAQSESSIFFYHNRLEIYRNKNESVFIYDNADLELPLAAEATVTVLKCSIMRQIQYMFTTVTAYVGMVQWISPPLSEDYLAAGSTTMHVWLSSSDVNPEISGYGIAVVDLDENGNVVGDIYYNYKYVDGKILSTEPTVYSLSLNMNHLFPKGHELAFQVLVGSTIQGWMANVYFDSPDRDSRAVLPGSAAVPEFENRALAFTLSILLVVGFLLLKKKDKKTKLTS